MKKTLYTGISSKEILTYMFSSLKYLYIFFISLIIFMIFSMLYGIEGVIKSTYILTKPTFLDVIVIYFLNDLYQILPFVFIFSLTYFSYKLNYTITKDVIFSSIFIGIFIYVILFVMVLLKPTIDNSISQSLKRFSTSKSTPKYLFVKNKIHNIGEERIILMSVLKDTVNLALIKDGKVQKFFYAKVVPYDNGIKIKGDKTTIVTLDYEKIIPSSFGKLYEKIYRGFIKIASQFPLTKYVEKPDFFNLLNLMLYVQAMSIGITYTVWLFRESSTTKIILLSVLVGLLSITVIGFISGILEFMKLSSQLEGVKSIISGLLALILSILIVLSAYKLNQILRGKIGV
ncbi:MAG: hypothetical protein ACP5KI_06340 [Brevinematia bacterium]